MGPLPLQFTTLFLLYLSLSCNLHSGHMLEACTVTTTIMVQKFIDVCKLVPTIQTSEKFRDFEELYLRYFSTNHKSLFFQGALSSGERFWMMQELVNFLLLLLFLYMQQNGCAGGNRVCKASNRDNRHE